MILDLCNDKSQDAVTAQVSHSLKQSIVRLLIRQAIVTVIALCYTIFVSVYCIGEQKGKWLDMHIVHHGR